MSFGTPAPAPVAAPDPQTLFKERFAQMAHDNLASRLPDVSDRISAFEVLDVDENTGQAVGVFAFTAGNSEVHIPVILSGIQIEPIDVMYLPDSRQWLPLTPKWVEFLDSVDANYLGNARKAPTGLQTDMDIRNVMVPPMTGRYSYASANGCLLDYLRRAGNRARKHAVAVMTARPTLAKLAFDLYGVAELTEAVRHREPPPAVEKIAFYDGDSDWGEMATAFGQHAPRAMSQLTALGYAVLDRRPRTKTAVYVETLSRRITPNEPGVYRLYLKDRRSRLALIIPAPQELSRTTRYGTTPTRVTTPPVDIWETRPTSPSENVTYLIYTQDGEAEQVRGPILARPVEREAANVAAWLAEVFARNDPPAPGRGTFLRFKDGRLQATTLIKIVNVSDLGDGEKLIKAYSNSGGQTYIRMGPSYRYKQISVMSTGEGADVWGGGGSDSAEVRIPDTYCWVPVKDLDAALVVRTANDVVGVAAADPKMATAVVVRVVHNAGSYRVNGSSVGSRAKAAHVLLRDFGLSVVSAENMLKRAAVEGQAEAAAMDSAQLAAGDQAGVVGGDPGMDPSMMDPATMDPSMMDPSMTAPDPTAMALQSAQQEVMTLIQMQQQEVTRRLEEQQRILAAQQEAIDLVMQRSQELLGGAPPMDPLSASMMSQQLTDQNMAQAPPAGLGGGAAYADAGPSPEPVPEGSLAAGAPTLGAGDVPVGPSTGMPSGMPADMGPGQPAGLGPSSGMSPVPPSTPEDVAQAAPGALDASMLASMATSEGLESLGVDYLPQLREAVSILARTLTDLRIKAPTLRDQLGDRAYEEQVERLRRGLTNLGPLTLDLHRNALLFRGSGATAGDQDSVHDSV